MPAWVPDLAGQVALALGEQKVRISITRSRKLGPEDLRIQFHHRQLSAAETIRVGFKRNLRRLPNFGESSRSRYELINLSGRQLAKGREFILSLKALLKHDQLVTSQLANQLKGITLYVDWLPLEIAKYFAIHPSGFCVITKKPMLKHLKRLLDICLHCRSTLLTPSGCELLKERLQLI